MWHLFSIYSASYIHPSISETQIDSIKKQRTNLRTSCYRLSMGGTSCIANLFGLHGREFERCALMCTMKIFLREPYGHTFQCSYSSIDGLSLCGATSARRHCPQCVNN